MYNYLTSMTRKKKKQITETVINLSKYEPILLTEEIIASLKVDDFVDAGFSGYNEGDSASDPFYFFRVYRDRDETKGEREKRLALAKLEIGRMRDRRYQSYLKLKAEFDN